jgi:hypothetical protein
MRRQVEVVEAQRKGVEEQPADLRRRMPEPGKLPVEARLKLGVDRHFLETLELGKRVPELIPHASREGEGPTDDLLDVSATLAR